MSEEVSECLRLTRGDLVQRRAAVKKLVVSDDFLQAGRRHGTTAQDISQKGPHVIHFFRPAKGDQQNGVVLHRK